MLLHIMARRDNEKISNPLYLNVQSEFQTQKYKFVHIKYKTHTKSTKCRNGGTEVFIAALYNGVVETMNISGKFQIHSFLNK